MIYKFRSKVTADVIMLGPNGDHMLRLIGREPAAKGIVEPEAMPEAVARLRAAIRIDEDDGAPSQFDEADAEAVALRPRLWPVIEMFERAHRAGEPVVWGV